MFNLQIFFISRFFFRFYSESEYIYCLFEVSCFLHLKGKGVSYLQKWKMKLRVSV